MTLLTNEEGDVTLTVPMVFSNKGAMLGAPVSDQLKCIDQAKLSYEAAKANPEMYAPLDQAIGGGAYGDDNLTDDFYWAACELYASTGEAKYYSDLLNSDDE